MTTFNGQLYINLKEMQISLFFLTYVRIDYTDPGGGYGAMLPQTVVFPIESNSVKKFPT